MGKNFLIKISMGKPPNEMGNCPFETPWLRHWMNSIKTMEVSSMDSIKLVYKYLNKVMMNMLHNELDIYHSILSNLT
jgi:hypothetical protein